MQRAKVLQRSALQRIYEVVSYLQRGNNMPGVGVKQSASMTKLAKTYKEEVRVVGEQVSDTFIFDAIKLWRTLLADSDFRSLLWDLDEVVALACICVLVKVWWWWS